MRRVLVPHRLAIPIRVRAAPPSARSVERAGRREPVSEPFEAPADVPGDKSAGYCGGVRRRLETLWRKRRREREECRVGTVKTYCVLE